MMDITKNIFTHRGLDFLNKDDTFEVHHDGCIILTGIVNQSGPHNLVFSTVIKESTLNKITSALKECFAFYYPREFETLDEMFFTINWPSQIGQQYSKPEKWDFALMSPKKFFAKIRFDKNSISVSLPEMGCFEQYYKDILTKKMTKDILNS